MPRIPRGEPTTRLNLEMTARVRMALEEMRHRTGAESMAEVIRRALAVYQYVVDAREGGEKVLVQGKDGQREIVIL